MSLATLSDRLAHPAGPPIDAVVRLAREVSALAATRPDRPPRALLVGGYVRDALLDRETTDADVEVFGVPVERLETLLLALFPGRVNTVGRSFGVFKVHLHAGIDLDVSLPRSDSKSGAGHRGFVVSGDPFLPFAEAARRRDFTVNAIACDPLTGELLDAHGGGDDLAAGTLRAVDAGTFPEDPLRAWRAFQFAARLRFRLERATVALVTSMVRRGDLAELSRERVTDEIGKLLTASTPSIGLAYASCSGNVQPTVEGAWSLWTPAGSAAAAGILAIDLSSRRRLRINGAVERISADEIGVLVRESVPNCPKYIQRRQPREVFSTPQRRTPSESGCTLDEERRGLVGRADTAFVGSLHPTRGVDTSHRGGAPGFIQVVDPTTLLVPDYPGNSMFMTLGNFEVDSRASLAALDFERGQVVSFSGWARLRFDIENPQHPTGGTGRYWDFSIREWVQFALPPTRRWDLLDSSPFNPPASGRQ
jgi:hypothetical protein